MKIPAWTYSQLEGFDTCPRQYHAVRVAKTVPYVQGVEAAWGDRVHKALEDRVKHNKPLPEGMTQWEGLVKKIASMPGEVLTEKKIALDKNFKPVDYFSAAAWTRGQGDVIVVSKSTGIVLDYKTGKRKLTDQLALYAGYMFSMFPELETVQSGFVWLKDKKIDREDFHRKDVPVIWQKFLPKVAKLESAHERDSWPARPSGLCKAWCPLLTCEFNGKRGQ